MWVDKAVGVLIRIILNYAEHELLRPVFRFLFAGEVYCEVY